MLSPDEKPKQQPSARAGHVPGSASSLGRPARSLATDFPHAWEISGASDKDVRLVLAEALPGLPSVAVEHALTLVLSDETLQAEPLRSRYAELVPLRIHQRRVFLLEPRTLQALQEEHSITLRDERPNPELPTVRIRADVERPGLVSLRLEFGVLAPDERWCLVDAASALFGVESASDKFQRLPEASIKAIASGGCRAMLGERVSIETLSTVCDEPDQQQDPSRSGRRAPWAISSLEYSEPDYEEQGTILRVIDPAEFAPAAHRNMLSSLLLHAARAFASSETCVSQARLVRAAKHLSKAVRVTFERHVQLGRDCRIDEGLDSAFAPEEHDELENGPWAPEDGSPFEEPSRDPDLLFSEAVLSLDASPDLPSGGDVQPQDAEEILNDPLQPGQESTSMASIEGLQGPFGAYRVSFCSEASALDAMPPLVDQLNDDRGFGDDTLALRIDFLGAHAERNRWKLIDTLHRSLSEMQVPEDEAHNLDKIDREFSRSELAYSRDQIAIYFGRMRVTASRTEC